MGVDTAIVTAAQQDSEQFSVLYYKYVDAIYRYIYYRVNRNQDQADELVSEVFCRALQQLPNYQDRGYPYSAYLYQIARSLCIDSYQAAELAPIEDVEVADRSDLTMNDKTDIVLLWKKVETLFPADTRELLQLRYIDDLPYEEIASIVDKPAGTVRTTISRALDKLRQSYD